MCRRARKLYRNQKKFRNLKMKKERKTTQPLVTYSEVLNLKMTSQSELKNKPHPIDATE